MPIQTLNDANEFLTPQDLVDLGLFPSTAAVYRARRNNRGPAWVSLGRKFKYPKAQLIEWVQTNLKAGK